MIGGWLGGEEESGDRARESAPAADKSDAAAREGGRPARGGGGRKGPGAVAPTDPPLSREGGGGLRK
jgi:hypothetical protein